MRLFYNISITKKLIIMQLTTTIIVVVVCSLVFLISDYYSMKSNKEKSLISITHVIGNNLVAPLLFDDVETGYEILNDLRVEGDVLNASILTTKNELFSSYKKEGQSTYNFNPVPVENEAFHYVKDHFFIAFPIMSETDRVGTLWIRADVSDIKKQLYNRSQMTFLVILFGAILSFLLVLLLQNYITKPINNLVHVMSQIMKQKNYSLRSQLHSGDEIGKMSNVFNELLDDVEHYSQKLVETNNELEQRVEARTQELIEKNEKLIRAKEKEEESNKIKEQFMASISHEIRTPLNAIIGFQELLQDTPLNEEQKEFLQSIDFAGRNLLVLINDILDMSKIEAGKFIFNETELNFRNTIRSVIELMEYRATEKGISLTYEVDDKIPNLVYGDQARLSQVLINLIGNAVKFTEKGFVKIQVKLESESKEEVRCAFRIEDSGIGIPKDKLEVIFNRFTQVSSDTTRKYGGTGLGLAIVKEIVELQGGKIGVESEIGVGSTFHFEFTFKKVKDKPINKSDNSILGINNHDGESKKLHGLLAEDIVLNQQLVKKIMEKWGYKLDIVFNGEEAIEKVKKNNYDFILMDIQMPNMDGTTATSIIRKLKDPIKSSIPIIALTAQASMAEADKCLEIGMNAYMSKPFKAQELKSKIQELVFTKKKDMNTLENKFQVVTRHFDLSHLIEHADGDKHFLDEIFNEFLQEMPRKLEEIRVFTKAKDVTSLSKTFHSLQGIFSTFGMHESIKLLNSLSTEIKKAGITSKVHPKFEKLELMINEAMEDLKVEMTRLT